MSLLADIDAILTQLPQEEKQSVIDAAVTATARQKWVPNPGPQTQAYFSSADETFYGGQAGGGKTDLGIGLALTAHQRTLILRRINKDALKIVPRLQEILGNSAGYNGQLQRWRLPGRQIDIYGCEQKSDKQRFKGDPHDLICVQAGTPVLLADQTYCPIEMLSVGQKLWTLEGPKRLERKYPTQKKECVEIVAFDKSGRQVAQQVQSFTHRILTNSGWLSVFDLGAPCESILCHDACMPAQLLLATCAKPWQRPSTKILDQRHMDVSLLPLHPTILDWARCVFDPQSIPESDFEAYYGRISEWPQLALSSVLPKLLRRLLEIFLPFAQRLVTEYVNADARELSSRVNFPKRYWSGIHQCDERIPRLLDFSIGEEAAQRYLPQRGDAVQPIPNYLQGDDVVRIQTHNAPPNTYVHPYRKDIRPILGFDSLHAVAFGVRPVGKRDVYDLQIEDVNHYITRGGFVNQNCFDEGTDFLESQYRFIVGWNRSTDPAQRCRVLVTSNPPTNAEGLWVVKYWAPWLDPAHPNPAKPGELRWFTTIEGEDKEVQGPGPHRIPGENKEVFARSRTYVPASLDDNPDLAKTSYGSVLASLPEELRRAYRDGDFTVGLKDGAFQTLPTAWILAAQARWKADGYRDVPMTAMAFDPAGGGGDAAELCFRHGGWYGALITARGEETVDGSLAAAKIIAHRRNAAPVVVDVGGGYGGAVTLRLKDNGIAHAGFNGAAASTARTIDGQLKFANKRAEAWWKFREALNPDQEGGSAIALPPDAELRADLAAPSYDVTARGILIESKDDLRKRLGRSPGKGDAVVMCLSEGNAAVKKQLAREALQATANRGFETMKRR